MQNRHNIFFAASENRKLVAMNQVPRFNQQAPQARSQRSSSWKAIVGVVVVLLLVGTAIALGLYLGGVFETDDKPAGSSDPDATDSDPNAPANDPNASDADPDAPANDPNAPDSDPNAADNSANAPDNDAYAAEDRGNKSAVKNDKDAQNNADKGSDATNNSKGKSSGSKTDIGTSQTRDAKQATPTRKLCMYKDKDNWKALYRVTNIGNACPDVGSGWEERRAYGVYENKEKNTSRFCVRQASDSNIGVKGRIERKDVCDTPSAGWQNIGQFYAHTTDQDIDRQVPVCIATASQYGWKQMYYPDQSKCKSGAWDRQQTFYAKATGVLPS